MSPAKVTSGEKSFYVSHRTRLNSLAQYDSLPENARRYLSTQIDIYGTNDGFIVYIDGREPIDVTVQTPYQERQLSGVGARWDMNDGALRLILPDKVIVEPVTQEQMKNEINPQRPSTKER